MPFDGFGNAASYDSNGSRCADPGRRSGPGGGIFEQSAVPRGARCPAPGVFAADFQRLRRVADPAARSQQTAVAVVLVEQLLRPSVRRRDDGGGDAAAAARGTGDILRAAILVQISISGAIR